MFAQFVKFCVVGGVGMVVDFGITFLCKEKLRKAEQEAAEALKEE